MNKSIFVAFCVLGLSACGNSFETVKSDIEQSVSDNRSAETISDWHASESNPEKLFPKWREMFAQKILTSAEVCEALRAMKDDELTIMQEQLDDEVNSVIVKDCKEELDKRIDSYYINDRKNLETNLDNYTDLSTSEEVVQHAQSVKGKNEDGIPGTFAPNIQYREMSGGYHVKNADVGPGEVVLTFDDGPSTKYTRTILDVLKKRNAKAIFFQLGERVKKNPELVKMVAAEGHAVGGHSMSHKCLAVTKVCRSINGRTLGYSEAINEIDGSMNALKKILGPMDPFFRFPYGESDANLSSYLDRKNMARFKWNIDSNDWKIKSSSELVEKTMNQVNKEGRGVILFHDIHQITAEVLPEILNRLYKGKYKVVLIKAKAGMTLPVKPNP